MIDFQNPDFVEVNGVTLAVYHAGPDPRQTDKPAVVFLHGFPELAYSWRAQMEALAAAGYPVFAPDQRGYGRSTKPCGKENYTMNMLIGDLTGLLDHYDLEDAVFVGHDWGALILWALPFYCPERVRGLAGLNVPLMKHYPEDPVSVMRRKLGDEMYIVRFQEEGACEPILEADMEATFRFYLRKPSTDKNPKPNVAFEGAGLDMIGLLQAGEDAWGGELLLPEDEMQIYVDAFKKGGFTAPLHWYRNMLANWEAQRSFLIDGALPRVEKPCLMITADKDRACPARLADGMEDLCAPYQRVNLQGCGHWSQQEKPDEVNAAILSWLSKYF